MKKILFPLLVLVMVLGLVVIPATPVDSAPADDDPRVCLTGISPATWVWLSGHAATSTAGLFHLTVDTVPYDGWCVDPDQQILVDNCFDAYLVNAPRQATPIDWCAIAYIMTNYSTFPDPLSPNREAAATQLAIWKYIKGGKTQILAYPAAVNERANDIYDLAAARAVNLFGPGLGLMNLWEGAGGSNSQVFNTAVTGSGCLDKIEVTFTTSAGSFSPTDPAITETTVLTDASGDVSATLYWDTSPFSASLTASTDGEWPVILEPEDPNIQSTAILKPFGLSVEKQFEPEIGPGLEVSKEADTEISKEGDEITYTITVNNTGDVDLDKMSVVDDLLPGVDAAFAATLVVGASETHDFVYTVKAGDPDPLVNEVTATYEDQTGTAVSDVATDTVDLVHPDLEVTKTAAPVSGEVGDTITYTIKVENKGDVELILDSVDDSLLGDLESSFASSLAALASESHDFTRDIDAGDPNPLVNTVVFHYDIAGLPNDITDNDDASVEVVRPGLEVTKEADTDISKEGDDITYTITVKNTGDVDLDKMSVVDDLLPGVDAAFAATLVVGASETHDFVYTVKAGDPDPLVNEVTATYEDQTGTAFSDVATDTVDLVHPDLEVTKTAAPVSGEEGDTITYTIKVENKGDVELILDSVDDSLLGDLESSFASSLAALASESHDFTRDIAAGDPNPLVNTVTFHYHIEGLPNDITDKDDASVEVIHKCHASIEGYKFFNNCCINGEWDDNEAGIAGWWIGLFPYEYPYPGSINPDPTTWGDIPKVQTVTDDPSTPDINELGMFTFENVCAGAYYVVEEKRDGWISCTTWFENTWWGLTLKNYPLRDHYVVVVTNDNADNGDTIKVDVYGDGLLFGNKD